jgi:hypothetical protein
MRPCFAAGLALALVLVGFPVRSETYRNPGPAFSIDYPEGWKILPGEGGLATRAVGPGSAMNVSVAAASRPDFDADTFSDAQLEQIAQELADATAGALADFELLERGKARLGGKPAAFFRYRATVEQPAGRVETVGIYYATAHRGLVYSVTGVTQAKRARRTQPAILDAIESFRFETGGAAGEAAP